MSFSNRVKLKRNEDALLFHVALDKAVRALQDKVTGINVNQYHIIELQVCRRP